jgi:hypothetical protein
MTPLESNLARLPAHLFEIIKSYYEDIYVVRLRNKYIDTAKRLRSVGRPGFTRPYHIDILEWRHATKFVRATSYFRPGSVIYGYAKSRRIADGYQEGFNQRLNDFTADEY